MYACVCVRPGETNGCLLVPIYFSFRLALEIRTSLKCLPYGCYGRGRTRSVSNQFRERESSFMIPKLKLGWDIRTRSQYARYGNDPDDSSMPLASCTMYCFRRMVLWPLLTKLGHWNVNSLVVNSLKRRLNSSLISCNSSYGTLHYLCLNSFEWSLINFHGTSFPVNNVIIYHDRCIWFRVCTSSVSLPTFLYSICWLVFSVLFFNFY